MNDSGSIAGASIVQPPRLPRSLRREQWTLGIVSQSAESIVRDGLHGEICWLALSKRSFLADPFALPLSEGRFLILAESLPYRTLQGEIVAAVTTAGSFLEAVFKPLLRQPVHLSYPQLVPWRGQWLLYCEAWEAGCLPVFAAADPLGPWREIAHVLPGVPIVDPTLVEHQGHWFLFATRQDDGPNRRLHLYHGETPLGPWLPHPRGVIVDDARCARPAGPFFRLSDGTLVRPAQDCSQTYGGAIQLFQVDHLSPADYVETFLRRVDPPAGPWAWGLHTLCPIDEASCLIDAKRWVSAPLDPFRFWQRHSIRLRRRRARSVNPNGL